MKIALLNGSPKSRDCASQVVLSFLKSKLQDNNEFVEIHLNNTNVSLENMKQILQCDSIVFAFPLYVDTIPSHLLNCLEQMEKAFKSAPHTNIKVYAIVNCGFYEGVQNRWAIETIRNWCESAGLSFGQGLGIGAGAMLSAVKDVPLGKGPNKRLGINLEGLAENVKKGKSEETAFMSLNFPRFLYVLSAHMGMNKNIKQNGLRKKDALLRK